MKHQHQDELSGLDQQSFAKFLVKNVPASFKAWKHRLHNVYGFWRNGPTMDLLEHPLVFWKNHENQIFTWKHMISEEAKHDSYPVLNES